MRSQVEAKRRHREYYATTTSEEDRLQREHATNQQAEPSARPEHTPLPWVVDEDSGIYYVVAPEVALIATLDPSDDDAPAEANAALIVSAVNSHALLVEALRELVTADVGGEASPDFYRAVDKARHALATVAKESGG